MISDQDPLYDALRRRLAASDRGKAWEELVAAGAAGFRIAEDRGGLGMGIWEAEPVMAALGDAGQATPFVESSVVAAGLLGRFAPHSPLLAEMARGDAVCAVAGLDPALRGELTASESRGCWSLRGSARLVLHADRAAAVMTIARIGDRWGLFLLSGHLKESVAIYPTIDGRSAADLVFDGVEASLLSADAGEAVEAALDEARACIAIEAAAIMRRLVRETISYTQERRQFGQALAKFQVVQHRLVDMDIQARRASAIAALAMGALTGPAEVRARLVSAAKATAASAGRYVGQQAVQLHGAMGMTEELPVASLFKRLTVIENELGSADQLSARHARLRESGR